MSNVDKTFRQKSVLKNRGEPLKECSRIYPVERILGKRIVGKKTEYLIKWKGYKFADCTWEPTKNLINIKEMIREFEREQREAGIGLVETSAKETGQIKPNLKFGSLEEGDEIEEILGVYPKNEDIMAMVKWKTDKNGIRPMDSLVCTKKFKDNEKNVLAIVNFYEKELKI